MEWWQIALLIWGYLVGVVVTMALLVRCRFGPHYEVVPDTTDPKQVEINVVNTYLNMHAAQGASYAAVLWPVTLPLLIVMALVERRPR